MITAKLKKCAGHDYCVSEEELKDFLRDKFILLLHNQIRFESRYFKEAAIVTESFLQWITINTQVRQSVPF